MDPLKVSAQFAAFTWSMHHHQGEPPGTEDAARFAQENWVAFLPYAHAGLGRLLIKISKYRTTKGGSPRAGRFGFEEGVAKRELARVDSGN